MNGTYYAIVGAFGLIALILTESRELLRQFRLTRGEWRATWGGGQLPRPPEPRQPDEAEPEPDGEQDSD